MGLLKIVFLILIFIFPLGEIARYQFNNGISITLNHLGVSIFVFFGILYLWIKKIKFSKNMRVPIIIFIAICILSLFVNIKNLDSTQFFISFLYLIRFVFYIMIYFIISGFDQTFKNKILKLMISIGGIIIAGGYIQYFFYSDLHNLSYLGWDEHMVRMFSSFFDPNFTGSFFVLYLVLIIGQVLEYLSKGDKIKILFFGLLSFITLFAIYLTFSRSAFLMLIVGMFTLFILNNKKKWILILLIFSFSVYFLFFKFFNNESMNLLRIDSSQARVDSAKVAIEIIRENPLLGVGFNTYRYAQIRYGYREEENALRSHADAGTDNSFLFVFATTGIIGLISYLYILFTILKNSFKSYKDSKNFHQKMLSAIVISSFAGIVVNAFFINSLFYPFIMEWLWILLGINSLNPKENN